MNAVTSFLQILFGTQLMVSKSYVRRHLLYIECTRDKNVYTPNLRLITVMLATFVN